MTPEIWVAILSFAGTVIGSLLGVIAASKLTNYRIEQLEKKVDKHNNVIERVFKLEEHEAVMETEVQHLEKEVEHLREYHT